MLDLLPWLLALAIAAPALMLAIPSSWADRNPARMVRLGRMAAGLALAGAVLAGVAVIVLGPALATTVGPDWAGFGPRFDALSAIMAVLVAFIGWIVMGYSDAYLKGDAGQGRFMRWLGATLGAVLILVTSATLTQFALAWIATSVALHQLLIFYADRPGAQLAARKKFVFSRVADASLILAAVLLYQAFGTLDFGRLADAATALSASDQAAPGGILAATLLLAAAALIKPAQFPMHGWLPSVMETPTPVSALLHAGIVNAGGFLILRLADVMMLSGPSLAVLAIVGGFTALFGSLVMLTQTSVKVSLAYSTLAQMGFMLLQCGLAAFPAALLHIVAHSLYKAHAFLSSGSVVDIARTSWVPSAEDKSPALRLAGGLAIGAGLAWTVGAAFGGDILAEPGRFALGMILVMALGHLIAQGWKRPFAPGVALRGLGVAALVAVAYFSLQAGATLLTAGVLPVTDAPQGMLALGIAGLVVVSFAGVMLLQALLGDLADRPLWQRLYVHLYNALYVDALIGRWLTRIWPLPGAGRGAA